MAVCSPEDSQDQEVGSGPGSYQIIAFGLGPGAHEILCVPFKSEVCFPQSFGDLAYKPFLPS